MLLSIAMIIKNEENNLKRSLPALKKMMEEINSELIIVDTGSQDKSVEIAKEYTDKVFSAEWNGNFADMRNISIRHSKGDWILVIDADEVLTDYNKLKEFFDKGICKRYNSATIEFKNIFSDDEKNYNLGSVIRLFKRYKNFKYIGAIHEQPLYKEPIFHRIARFNHYGYFFVDEELRVRKDNRNKEILLSELKKQPNNQYINYQLAMQFIISNEYNEALEYAEKAAKLNVGKKLPIYLQLCLANLYIELNKYNECEELCEKYIEYDNKNVDIYFHLAKSQECLGKFDRSLESYKRYNYLLDNYEITTQANNIYCACETAGNKTQSKIQIIKNYYSLDMYKEIINEVNNYEDEVIENVLTEIIISAVKTNKDEIIKVLYERFNKTLMQKKKVIRSIENAANNVNNDLKMEIYKLASELDCNYGQLNKMRIGMDVAKEKIIDILGYENEIYYGEFILYLINEKEDIKIVVSKCNYSQLTKYFNYLVLNKRECIGVLYNLLLKEPLQLNENNMIWISISRALLFVGNLVGEKYSIIFKLYIMYVYESIKYSYKDEYTEEKLLREIKDEEERFVLRFCIIQRKKENAPIEYIQEMKKLLVDFDMYSKSIELKIKEFEKQISEGKELIELKKEYKDIINKNVIENKLDIAKKQIEEYEDIFTYDKLNNIRAIININEGDFENTMVNFKLAYCNNREDIDLLFNIAYVYENLNKYENALDFYKKVLSITDDEEIKVKVVELKKYK